jgi:hypothetical protein
VLGRGGHSVTLELSTCESYCEVAAGSYPRFRAKNGQNGSFSTGLPPKVDNLSTFPVTEGIFYTFSTGYPRSFPRLSTDVSKTVDNPADNRGQAVDKLGVTFFARAATSTVVRRCG